jgi:hypothetical protein
VSQLAFDGKEDLLFILRSADRKPPFRYGAAQVVESDVGDSAAEAAVIERVCRAITQ